MIYLLNKLDFSLIEKNHSYVNVDLFETNEWKVKNWIQNERCRTIFNKQEVKELFDIDQKVQIVKVESIKLEPFDKIIIWTSTGKYWVLKVLSVS